METTAVLRPYVKITTPDGKHFVWIKRPDREHRACLISNFGMNTAFADAIDKLSYLTVEQISRIDTVDMCTIIFRVEGKTVECMNRLIEDIPDILDKLELQPRKNESL